MTVEPMTDEEFWFDASLLDAENQALFEVAPIAKFRRWADHMRETGTALHTKAGITIDAALLDAVLATISTLTAERDQHANAYIDLHGQHVAKMLELADARTALKRVEAERDAAVARAMPEPHLLRTVEDVEALPVGLYLVRHRGEDCTRAYDRCPSVDVRDPRPFWVTTGEPADEPDDVFVDSVVCGPLPDLPIPTEGETP